MDENNTLKKTALLALLASAAAITPSLAQQTPPAPGADTTAKEDEAKKEEVIVVTGSRLKKTEYTSASPVQVITQEQATLAGLIDTSGILQDAAIAKGTFQTNTQLTGFVTTGGPGVSTVGLRGLGSNRTLVLINGRRAGPAGVRGQVQAVDLNTIPASVIERVEILTDGASSIYGSDALGGVINVITTKTQEGFNLNFQGTNSLDGGGNLYRANGSWGKVFDKGYINVSLEYIKQQELLNGDRDDTACQSDYLFSPGGGLVDYIDPATGAAKCGGLFTNVLRANAGTGLGTQDLIYPDAGVTYPGASQGQNSAITGMVRQRRAGFPATFPYAHLQDPIYEKLTVISPSERTSLYVTGGYDLTPDISAYAEVLYNNRNSEQDGVRQFFPTLNVNNPGAARPDTGGKFLSVLPIIPKTSNAWQDVDYVRALAGLKGTFGSFLSGWDWDLAAQYSKSDASYTNQIIYNDRVNAVTGALGCNTAAPNISNFNCADLGEAFIPWTSKRILAGQFNDGERKFLFTDETGTTSYTHQYVEGFAQGDLFQLPAGPIATGVGFQIRKEEIDDTPGFNARNANLWGSTAAGRTAGSDTVKELFAEAEIPILKGAPLFDHFTVNLSGRSSDYDSYGSSTTYKGSFDWQVTNWLRFRGAKGSSFRAPALYELFLANQTSFTGQGAVDPCLNWQDSTNPRIQANCAAAGVPGDYTAAGSSSALIVTGGGKGVLEPETGSTKTIGLIWTPTFADFSLALDYWETTVKSEIAQFGAGNIAFSCYNSAQYPNSPFCQLVQRAPANDPNRPNQIIQINDSYVNLNRQDIRGLDMNARYKHEFSFGKMTVDAAAFWTFQDDTALFAGGVNDYLGTTYNYRGPDFTGQANIRFDRKDWTFNWNMSFIGKGSDTETFGGDVFNSTTYASQCRLSNGTVGACTSFVNASGLLPSGTAVISVPLYFKQETEFTSYHDFTVRRKFDDWAMTVGVLNAFDERPPSQSSGQFRRGTAALNGYDMVGRRLYLQISKKF